MQQALVNVQDARHNAGNDEALMRELAEVFLASSDELASSLTAALDSGDNPSLARAAHTFKSPLGFFGATGSVDLAQQIESRSDAGVEEGLSELVDQLLADVRQMQSELLNIDF